MPLTSSNTGLSSIDEDRRRAAALLASSMGAVKSGNDVIANMQDLAKTARGEARQKGLDEQAQAQQGVVNEREGQRLTLEKSRADVQNASDAQRLVLEKAQADRAQSADERAAQTFADNQRQTAIEREASAAAASNEDPQALVSRLHDTPEFHDVPSSAVASAYQEAQDAIFQRAQAEKEKRNEFDLRQKTEADTNARGWASINAETERAKIAAASSGDKQPAQLQAKAQMVASASRSLDSFEKNLKKYSKNTTLPVEGAGAMVRKLPLIGRLTDQGDKAKTEADAAGINALVFSVLGRTDAPADQEITRLKPLMIDLDSDTPEVLSGKTATLRRMLNESMGIPAPAESPVAAETAAPRPLSMDQM